MTTPADLWGPISKVSPDDPIDLRVINATTINGKLAIGPASAGIGNTLDADLLRYARHWADCVLAGAGTVRAENYGGVQLSASEQAARQARGQSQTPPIAVVTGSLNLDPGSRFFQDTTVPPIVLHTTADDSPLRHTSAQLVRFEHLHPTAILNYLSSQGFRRILLEGGPSLVEQFAHLSLIDGYHLTVSPLIASAGAMVNNNAAASIKPMVTRMNLLAATSTEDGMLFLRYHR